MISLQTAGIVSIALMIILVITGVNIMIKGNKHDNKKLFIIGTIIMLSFIPIAIPMILIEDGKIPYPGYHKECKKILEPIQSDMATMIIYKDGNHYFYRENIKCEWMENNNEPTQKD